MAGLKLELVTLYKKGMQKSVETIELSHFCTESHARKILLIIILNRMKLNVEEGLSDCQAGYQSNR